MDKEYLKGLFFRRIFLYPYMITSPAILALLLVKYRADYLKSKLHLSSIVFFCHPCYYNTMNLDTVFPCPTWVIFILALIGCTFFISIFGSHLFDKYRQHVYQTWYTNLISYYAVAFYARLSQHAILSLPYCFLHHLRSWLVMQHFCRS